MIKLFNLLLCLVLISCVSTTTVVDTDDLYFSGRTTDTIVVKKRIRYIGGIGSSYPAPYYYPMGGWWGTGYNYGHSYEWHRPKYIIVQPTTPGKRPSRDGNFQKSSPNIRRGR